VAGGRGNDLALLGAGDDVFVWNPGDGSDIVEGQDAPTRAVQRLEPWRDHRHLGQRRACSLRPRRGGEHDVFIEATNGNDAITRSMQNGKLVVDGLSGQTVIEHFDLGDEIHVLGLGGDDGIDITNLGSGGPIVIWDGGAGNDVLVDGLAPVRVLLESPTRSTRLV
jgi:hypothetical protein